MVFLTRRKKGTEPRSWSDFYWKSKGCGLTFEARWQVSWRDWKQPQQSLTWCLNCGACGPRGSTVAKCVSHKWKVFAWNYWCFCLIFIIRDGNNSADTSLMIIINHGVITKAAFSSLSLVSFSYGGGPAQKKWFIGTRPHAPPPRTGFNSPIIKIKVIKVCFS